MKKVEKYNSLNGLRAFACIGILLMHALSNGNYEINHILTTVIQSFTQFVYLFMIISSFSMCCGYYEKIKNNKISLEEFYIKRIKKIMPFFIFLIIIDVIYNHNFSSLIEGFADATMMFSFLPNSLSVIGVGWFLGLVFIFYMIFPFFVFLFSNKKRAWFVTFVALIMNLVSILYFGIDRTNMFYSFIYFCIGGLIYLYKDNITNYISKNKYTYLFLNVIFIFLYYIISKNNIMMNIELIIIFTLLICYSISINTKILDNKFTSFISNISLEIYLSHMFVFRIIEKLQFTNIFSNVYFSYIITCCICLIGTLILAKLFDLCFKKISEKIGVRLWLKKN